MPIDQTDHTSAQPDLSDTPLPVLWLCGAPGAGKSVVAWEVFDGRDQERIAYVDIDQLTMLGPTSGDSFELAAANLLALVEIHRSIGTQALIVSGVIDPEQMPVLESAVSGSADMTWFLVDAKDAVLRRRLRQRGWTDQLVERAIAEAHAWRAVPHLATVDTTSTIPADAATEAEVLLAPRPAATSAAGTQLGTVSGNDLVVIYGPRAVGKSTISWALFKACADRDEPTGYLDADQLGFVHADAEIRDRLIRRAVVSIAHEFRQAGAVRTIVNGNLSAGLLSTWEPDRALLVHMDAPLDTLRERIAARTHGDAARLAGDDLTGASSDTRAGVLEQARHQRDEYAGTISSAFFLDVTAPGADVHVNALRHLLADERARP